LPGGQYTKVGFKKLKCDLINLEVFNKLEDAGIVVNENKAIKMMLEEEIKGIMVGDKLRECLINEDSENYCVFNEEERREFLFKLFSSLVLGGAMCQYEDKATEYFERTKELYKSIVSARKDPKTNNIFIESHAFEIQKIEVIIENIKTLLTIYHRMITSLLDLKIEKILKISFMLLSLHL